MTEYHSMVTRKEYPKKILKDRRVRSDRNWIKSIGNLSREQQTGQKEDGD